MNDVELLREAARLMRERATAANPSPWARPLMDSAVADWLDEAASHLEDHIPAWTAPSRGIDDPPAVAWNNPERLASLIEHHFGHALAVARVYLGVGR